jgi:hypothetical protein
MDKDMFNKLAAEQPMTAEEALRLDAALESDSEKLSRHALSALGEDSPSLAWRSALNQRLAHVSRRRRQTVYWRFGVAASGVAAATVFVLSFMMPSPPSERLTPRVVERGAPAASLEDAIIGEHEDQMGQASLGVMNVAFNDTGS